ncbi:hypothetical protein [Streptomyces chiangmaiensis]|uniref:Uncharacterized protein n=1 Tax=Streptomyces chiangmaiensis TaxID=766497 RepID=A0ABU7FJU0_9ACTN|nr:hypothetical protein [Streptomyces chiangmaiensis]MED7824251.1 hypothetical protein [Streptomyces chiangmaiensis]
MSAFAQRAYGRGGRPQVAGADRRLLPAGERAEDPGTETVPDYSFVLDDGGVTGDF